MVESRLACPTDHIRYAPGSVPPVKGGEHVRPGTLHAERDPRVAGGAQLFQCARVHGLGVRLGRHLGVRGDAELRVDHSKQRLEVLDRK